MKTTATKKLKTETVQPKANKQAGMHQILQRYKQQTAQLQAVEEEELLQGKFETAQRMELDEEEPLQGKFETTQRMEAEEEEPVQSKFATTQLVSEEQAMASKPNNTGLPDKLKNGIENLSGYSMDDVKVHYNSDKPAQLQAHAYAQGTDIHIAPGQEKHLPHEAWHVVQQKQGRVRPTMQMKGTVPVNDDAGLEKEANVMGATAVSSNKIFSIKSNFHNSRTPSTFQFVKLINKFIGLKMLHNKRYRGYNSTENMDAISDVIRFRNGKLSYPESEALSKSTPNSRHVSFGRNNINVKLPYGTAICHKISDNEIRSKIVFYLRRENKINRETVLNNYLSSLVRYIKPSKNHNTPSNSIYEEVVTRKHKYATKCLNELRGIHVKKRDKLNPREDLAHEIGRTVVNSPVNLFIGDSLNNSKIQERRDFNTDSIGNTTPRSSESSKIKPSIEYKQMGLSSSKPK